MKKREEEKEEEEEEEDAGREGAGLYAVCACMLCNGLYDKKQ